MTPRKIILASASPRRKELLESIGLNFKVVKSHYDEKFNPRLGPKSQAEFLSKEKGRVVAEKYPDALVISADEIVAIGHEMLGKAKDAREAKSMLLKLQGKCHQVITAFTIIDGIKKKTVTKSETTNVYFKKLTRNEIDAFLKHVDVLDFAGAYTIRGKGALLIEKIEGDYNTIVGLPLFSLVKELKRFGINILH
jgi:septum formation protein